MSSGVVTSISQDRRGDTLAVAAVALDTVLAVTDSGDFSEDFSEARFLIVGSETTAREYIEVDNDANTVTLGAAVGGSGIDAGETLELWDPTVGVGGDRVVEYVAQVQLYDGSGTTPATLTHGLISASGVFGLVGASVTIDLDDEAGDWFVSRVLGREVKQDLTYSFAPIYRAVKGTNATITSGTWTRVAGWFAFANVDTQPQLDGRLIVNQPGVYDCRGGVTFLADAAGVRGIRFIRHDGFGGTLELRKVQLDNAGAIRDTAIETNQLIPLTAGQAVSLEVWHTNGTTLDIIGSNPGIGDPVLTSLDAMWVRPI